MLHGGLRAQGTLALEGGMAPAGTPLTRAWGDGGRESSPRAHGPMGMGVRSAAMGATLGNSGTGIGVNSGNTRGARARKVRRRTHEKTREGDREQSPLS